MQVDELEAYYQAGIGVAAESLSVSVRSLTVGQQDSGGSWSALEPFDDWYWPLTDEAYVERYLVEDYLTVCLAGSAGHFIRTEARRCHLKRSMGSAGLELTHLRKVWQATEAITDRAFAIAFSLLRSVDDGDTDATLYRLWHRAVRLLRRDPQREQLDRLARELMKRGQMTGLDVSTLLRT